MKVRMCQLIEVIRCVIVENEGTEKEETVTKYYHKDGRELRINAKGEEK